ncbi:hypothetical protein BDW22DRAFT_1353882, partial [Trametopsis cervina]
MRHYVLIPLVCLAISVSYYRCGPYPAPIYSVTLLADCDCSVTKHNFLKVWPWTSGRLIPLHERPSGHDAVL